MDRGCVRGTTDQPVERVDLTHDMPLAQAADGRVTGHGTDRATIEGKERGFSPAPCRSGSRLGSGVSTADYHNIEHGAAIVENWPRRKPPPNVPRGTLALFAQAEPSEQSVEHRLRSANPKQITETSSRHAEMFCDQQQVG